MCTHKKFSIISLVVFLSLVFSLVFPLTAMADDSTPPLPAAPVVDNSAAQTGNTDSSSNAAAPSNVAPAGTEPTDASPKDVAPTDEAATDAPSSSTDAAPMDSVATDVPVGSTDVAPIAASATDAPSDPTDVAVPDASATDAPSNSTEVEPTDAAVKDVPSAPTSVASTDAAATDASSGPKDIAPSDSVATDATANSTDVEPTEPVVTEAAVEPTSDVVAALNVAGAVLLDESGNSVPLVSQQAADALANGDPYFNDGAGHIVGYTTPGGTCNASVTSGFCYDSITPLQAAITAAPSGATISMESAFYNENVIIAKQITLIGILTGTTVNSFTLNSGADTTGSINIFAPVVNVNAGAIVQNGVDLAAVGGTVNVSPGNYLGQVVINNKNITLQATAPGVVIAAPDPVIPGQPSLFLCDAASVRRPVICVNNSSNVIIKGLTVDGRDQGDNNWSLVGIDYFNSGGTVQGNTIENIRNSTFSGVQAGVAMYAYNLDGTPRTLNVFGNTIFNYQKNGMALSGNGLTVNVQNNTVTGAGPTSITAQNGIQVSYGATGTISGNTVSGNFWTGTYGGSNDPISDPNADGAAGILIYQPASAAIQVFNNEVLGNQFGIAAFDTPDFNIHDNNIQGIPHTGFGYPAGIVLSNSDGTIQNNAITINDYGVLVFDTPDPVGIHNNTITANTLYGVWSNTLTDATNNWWGDASGPYDNSGGTDACGLTVNNPTGSGNSVSTCVIYDPWLTKDPSAAAGTGGATGGNGRGNTAPAIVTTVIPVTGGQPVTLSCDNPSATMQIGEIQVTFTGLCGYDVVLNLVTKADLPGDLGPGNSFDDGLSISLLKDGKEIETLPANTSIQVSYPKPTSGSPSVMTWGGSTWRDQASFVVGNKIISILTTPATLVLITH